MRQQKNINSELCHDLLQKTPPKLSYRQGLDYNEWKSTVKTKFEELTGITDIKQNVCPLNFQIEWRVQKDGYELIRFTVESEPGAIVPCYLCIPRTGKKKYPVAIVLQGHSTGFHNSIGEPKYGGDEDKLSRTALALQAVENGFIALAIEQRGMGERRSVLSYGKENKYFPRYHMCAVGALKAIALGRTIIGERVWDVHKAIDALSAFNECDLEKILITGNSGGGTASFYAVCYDERIQLSVPSCSFSPYASSIFSVEHCACNYIPSVYKWFDMQDLACLIAPRNLIVITGAKDEIFPVDGVKEGFETVKKIYKQTGAEESCRLVETPMHHWWCKDIVWTAINQQVQRLGWK